MSEIHFDKIHGKFIYSLLRLKARSLGEHMGLVNTAQKICGYEISHASSFFSNLSDQIDPLLVYFLNEGCSKIRPYKEILEPIIFNAFMENHKENDIILEIKLKIARDDIEDVFNNRMNFITSSNFVDFTVSSYSVFEKWMGKLYESVKNSNPSSGRKKKDLENLIIRYGKSENQEERNKILEKIMGSSSSYVSSAEMIQFVLAHTRDDYPRNKVTDRKIIEFYGARRNTIHNIGIHTRKTLEAINIKGKEIKLEQSKPAFTTDFTSLIDHCEELLDIYGTVLTNLSFQNMNFWLELGENTEGNPQ